MRGIAHTRARRVLPGTFNAMSGERFYITTPIYYATAVPHIGTAYTTIAADAVARFKRLCGADVHFLTGTDEHGLKVQREAQRQGVEPIKLVDRVAEGYQQLWHRLNISHDDFIRTTQPRHEGVVQEIFQKLYDQGDLYPGNYEGWYCVSCEAFLKGADKKAAPVCPDCGKAGEWYSEPTYFFRFSKYEDRLLNHFEKRPDFVRPVSRYNEVLNRIREGLRDLSVTRSGLEWAVPLPFDARHRAYVWIDALINYVSAIGYGSDDELFGRYWPADVHLIGKDIVWFHAAIWPCVLMAIGLAPPKQVFAHGWWTHNGEKMAKSRSNFVNPEEVVDDYGTDALRYFVLRELTFGQDGDFSDLAMHHRYHGDLANDLGNLVYRTLSMVQRYFDGEVPTPEAEREGPLAEAAAGLFDAVATEMDRLQFSRALEVIWRFIRRANKFVEERQPWRLAKDPDARPRLGATMYQLAEAVRITGVYIEPFMPESAQRIREQLGLTKDCGTLPEAGRWGGLNPGGRVARGAPLFPRVEKDIEGPIRGR